MKLALALLAAALPLLAVDGVVLNGTTGQPQAGVAVALLQPGAGGMQQLGSAKSDAQGQFKIDKEIPPGPGLLQATYQGGTYNQIITPGTPTTGVQLKVYESTKDPAAAKSAEHLILIEPSASNLKVSETFIFQNQGNTTYNDPVKGSAQFFLPASVAASTQVTVSGPGGMPIRRPALKTAQAGMYKVDYPLKPGETRFDVSYSLPATKKFAGKIMSSAAGTHLVTPSAVTLTGDGIELAGQEPQTLAHIYNVTGLDYNVLIDGQGSLREASAGAQDATSQDDDGASKVVIGPARIYSRLAWVLGLTFGILALGGFMLYKRGTV
jgi:hypothetical protein